MSTSKQPPVGGLEIGRLFGIAVVLDWSLILVVALVTAALSLGPLTFLHSDWPVWLRWAIGFSAAVLLFVSILAHELSHALVARRYGTPVARITLFLFGGMAHMDQDPPSWQAELWIALAGPAMSVVVGVLFLMAAAGLIDAQALESDTPQQMFAALGPLATLLFWTGNVNVVLALFNLVPAYPLDGGRVLRAVLWAFSGDLITATLRAAASGQVFGWLLISAAIAMVLGVQLPIVGGGLVAGLWLGFIGWFIQRAAVMSQHQAVAQRALGGVSVRELMRTQFHTVTGAMSLEELVERHILPEGQRGYPVVEGEEPVGIVSLADVRRVPRDQWSVRRVAEVMTGADRLVTVEAHEDSFRALAELAQRGLNQLPVLEGRRIVGLLQREDLMHWLMVGGSSARRPDV